MDFVPNCYAWALNYPHHRLDPGQAGPLRGEVGTPVLDNEDRSMVGFAADLTRLEESMLDEFPAQAWIVSAHRDFVPDGDFHVRKLDVEGWSEKPGDHRIRPVAVPTSPGDLLDITVPPPLPRSSVIRYPRFVGFFVVTPDSTPPPPLRRD